MPKTTKYANVWRTYNKCPSNDSSNSDVKTFDNSKVYSFPCIASSSTTHLSKYVCLLK